MATNKKRKSIDCLCHKDGVSDHELSLFTDISWKKFKAAANIRNDQIADKMSEKWDGGPFGSYHRKCYQSYTAKNVLDRLEKRKNTESASSIRTSEEPSQPLRRSSIPDNNIKLCAVCQDEKPDPKDRRRKEKLSRCETMEAGKNLEEAARIRGDQRLILTLTGKDPIAIELAYHRTCYRRYTNSKELENILNNSEEKQESQYDAAFGELASEIELKVLQNHEILKMSDLRKQYIDLLHGQGIQNPHYRSEKLKLRIQKAYLGKVSFWHPRNRAEAEIVYCEEVPKGQLVECCMGNSYDEIEEDTVTQPHLLDVNHIYHAAKTVRSALLNTKLNMSWPPHSADMNNDKVDLPNSVFNLLAWILTDEENAMGDNVKKAAVNDEQTLRFILSLGQDLLFNVSKGRCRTP